MASHTINTRSLAALVAITQNVFLARSLRAPICGHVTTAECRYTLVLQALCSIEFLAHATFTCTGSTFSNLHKNFLSRTRSDPHQVQPAHKRISLRVHASQFRVPATRQRTLNLFRAVIFSYQAFDELCPLRRNLQTCHGYNMRLHHILFSSVLLDVWIAGTTIAVLFHVA